MRPSCRVRQRRDLLEVTLDTPSNEYNILSHAAATELLEILAAVDPSKHCAVVFRTAKRGSFINGVGLMMAGTAREPGDVERMTRVVREAYRAVRRLALPTIAVVQGNCFGCGVEFALHCTFRVAERTCDTQFYMTELADYLFIPAFGSTRDLPRLIGLEKATQMLLWGRRLSADEAASIGLIDAALDAESFERALDSFLAKVRDNELSPRAERLTDRKQLARCDAAVQAAIGRLPRAYQAVYAECYALLREGACTSSPEAHYRREVDACGRTVLAPIAKNAMSFFFVRQLAIFRCGARRALCPSSVIVKGADLEPLGRDLARRRIRGVEVSMSASPNDAPGGALLLSSRLDENREAVCVRLELDDGLDVRPALCLLGLGTDRPFAEVVASRKDDPVARATCALLHAAGIPVALTHSTRGFLSCDLVGALFGPLVAHVLSGRPPEDALVTLRNFGFVRTPAAVALAGARDVVIRAIARQQPFAAPADPIRNALDAILGSTAPGTTSEEL
jgi:enoyl-CoA hydratase/carnithine racemase